ncbi:uncharacterized protein LOC119083682 [Bradysia coprophila]|uniref:uncharacterized protein LOC119083682 n=1 Tax=Bradysia coprophila TaxID=38358 RepID=UPI00187D7F60|nr:uncharacterized protein LOC119083682 [Bradysia coprophila]
MTEIYKIYKQMIERPTEPGFHKVNGFNSPKISYSMILNFMAKNAERQAKPPKKEYLDEDIDFVQIKTALVYTKLMCLIMEKGQSYTADRISVVAVIDSKRKEFTSVVCKRCEGRQCDHVVAFLFWMYRRSNEPNSDRPAFWGCNPPTELISMPLKQLYHISQKFEDSDDVKSCSDDVLMEEPDDSSQVFLDKFLDNLKENGQTDSPVYRMHRHVDEPYQNTFLYYIMNNADQYQITQYKHLLMHLQSVIKSDVIDKIQTETSTQYKSRLWLELQYGRIRCSILNEVASWKTEQDVAEAKILGTYRIPREEEYLKRKQRKRSILAEISKCYKTNIQHCGLLLDLAYPFFCATPDGLSDDLVVEIKMPSTQVEYAKYLVNNETIPPKYFAQIQMQMFLANRLKALYCVVAPDFAKSGAVEYINVDLNKTFIEPLFAKVEDVWNKLIFPIIQRNAAEKVAS